MQGESIKKYIVDEEWLEMFVMTIVVWQKINVFTMPLDFWFRYGLLEDTDKKSALLINMSNIHS